MKNSDLPAMSCEFIFETDAGTTHEMFRGLTKREHFAGLAMQGYIAAGSHGMPTYQEIAVFAVETADALLAELDKEEVK